MLPFATGAAASLIETGAVFVAAQSDVPPTSTLATLGAQAGDLIVCVGTGTYSIAGGGAGFVTMSGGGAYAVVVSGNLSNKVIKGEGTSFDILIYRGAVSCQRVASDSSSIAVTSRSVAGFTKNAKHAGLIAQIQSSTIGAALSVGKPASFAQRALYNASTGTPIRNYVADRLQPVNPYYVSNTAIEWSSAGADNSFRLLELLSA